MSTDVYRLAFSFLLLALGSGLARAGGDPILARIVGDWKKRQDAIRAMRCVAKGEAVFAKGYYSASGDKPLPAKDTKLSKEVEWVMDFSKNWTRRDCKGSEFYWGSGTFYRCRVVDVSDGRRMVQLARREENVLKGSSFTDVQPDIMLKGEAFKNDFFLLNDFPIFFVNARVLTNKRLPNGLDISCPVSAGDFVVRGKTVFQGRECVVLRSAARDVPTYEYWVDATRGSAVLRLIIYAGTEMTRRLDFVYKDSEYGPLPASWVLTIFKASKGGYVAACEERMSVTTFSVNPKLDITNFQLAPSPGMNVAEKGKIYELQADGSQKVLYTYDGGRDVRGGGMSLFWVGLALLPLVVVGLLWSVFNKKARN